MLQTILAVRSWTEISHDFQDNWPIYLSMPLMAAIIGYTTKLLAIEMLYRPIEFKGIGPIGWQGVLPRRAGKVAGIAIDTLTRDLLKPAELLERIDPDELVRELEAPLNEAVDEIAREVVEQYRPGLWDSLPETARRAVKQRARDRAPEAMASLLEQIRSNVDQVIDLKYLAVSTMVKNKALLNELMRNTAGSAMRFMRRTGVVFGFGIGLVQMVAWAVFHSIFIMPAFGFFTGLASDWLAIHMLFRPVEPKRYFGLFRWQGMLYSERGQITKDYSKVVAKDLFSSEVLFEAVLTGPGSDRLFLMVEREVAKAIDEEAGIAQPVVQLAVGTRRYQALKETVARHVVERAPELVRKAEDYAMRTLAVEHTIADKMSQLTDDQYEAILRPAFKDDEWLVILIGALLGFAVGELQVELVHAFGAE